MSKVVFMFVLVFVQVDVAPGSMLCKGSGCVIMSEEGSALKAVDALRSARIEGRYMRFSILSQPFI